MKTTIVVVGAGVSGLTTALLLSRVKSNEITLVAREMPGDYNPQYASPWAGATFVPPRSEDLSDWEKRSWPYIQQLAREVPEAGIHFQRVELQRRDKDTNDPHSGFPGVFAVNPWFRTLFDDFKELEDQELVPGYDAGFSFTGVCINTAVYLPWLVGQCAKNGVTIKRARLGDIGEARNLSDSQTKVDFIVNCTGLGSLFLGGIRDTSLQPARGQTVLVRNKVPLRMFSGTDDGHSCEMFMMERALGGGSVIGGTYELSNWDPNPDPNTALRMMKRAVDAYPAITDGQGVAGLDIVRHGVGFRPFREGGPRVEKEKLDQETWIVHNYGHDSWGYLGSFGCAEAVLKMIQEAMGMGSGGSRRESRL